MSVAGLVLIVLFPILVGVPIVYLFLLRDSSTKRQHRINRFPEPLEGAGFSGSDFAS